LTGLSIAVLFLFFCHWEQGLPDFLFFYSGNIVCRAGVKWNS